ncbi:MipA/OmpV family protein [Psychrobacter sp. CCUG 69069]|jgi:outer membrane protein|uniref:MipA/OmpV family protein n=1 Tax=Psychrobacter namhaensis TaxID=292734 RepID=A0ABW8LA44_9GAMM|nr:MipA/OmpV family protein [Psychrobacter sp. CCUG 69069]MCD1280237.1 MipA/OmpV family protein [Psychrobacter sp. CCUG 69069]
MFKLAALPHLSTRNLLGAFTATALCSMASMSSAAPFKNLPADQDAVLSVGVNVMAVKSAYDLEDSTEVRVLPGAFYDNNKFYVRGAQAGAYLINDGANQLSAYAKLAGSEFEPDDANGALQGLDKRKSSVEAGLSYQRRTAIGGFRAQFGADVLDNSGGNTGRLTYLSRYSKDKLTVYPSFGFEYHDADYNEYYYGVSDQESAETGVAAYKSNSSLNPYINISANYDFNDKWAGFANQSLSYLSNEQYDSPMVDSRTEATTTLGLLYKF